MNTIEDIMINKNRVLVIHNKNGSIQRVILYCLGIIIFGLPIIGLVLNLSSETEEGGGKVVFGILLYTLLSILLSRYLFWGLWGKELITIRTSEISVQYDYKIWKTRPKTFEIESSEFQGFLDTYDEKSKKYYLLFGPEKTGYQSVLKLKREQIMALPGCEISVEN